MIRSLPWLAQTASAGSTGPDLSLDGLLDILRDFAGPLIVWLLLTQAAGIVVYWAASRVVNTGENGTLGNAFKVYLFSLLAAVLAPVLLVVVAKVTGSDTAILLAGLIFVLYVAFAIPMKVYDIGFGRALGWLLICFLFNLLAGYVLSFAFAAATQQLTERLAHRRPAGRPPEEAPTGGSTPTTSTPSRPPVEQRSNADRSPTSPTTRFEAQERLAGDRSRSQSDRLAALTEMYRQLEQERLALPPGDTAARAAFDQRRARYDAALQKLRAEQPSPRPTPRPAK